MTSKQTAELRDILLKLPDNGKKFERLIRLALERVLGRRVWAARSGSQLGADMGTGGSGTVHIRCEAKQYRNGSGLKERDLRGELSEAVEHSPELDLWILASTSEVPEQIAMALARQAQKQGIGVSIVDLSDSPHCKLPLLLVAARDEVCSYVAEHVGAAEATSMESLLHTLPKTSVDDLKHQIIDATALFDMVAATVRDDLERRCRSEIESQKLFNQAVLDDSYVPRQAVGCALDGWFSQVRDTGHLFGLCGDEGFGKTWAAVGWLLTKTQESDLLPISLW